MIALLLTCIYTQAQRIPRNIQKSLLVFSPLDLLWILTGLSRWWCDSDSLLLLCWVDSCRFIQSAAVDERGWGRWRILSKRSPFNKKTDQTRDVTRGQHLRGEDGSSLDATLSWLAAPAGDRLNCEDLSPNALTDSTESLNEQQDGWVTATQPLTGGDFISATYKIWWGTSHLYMSLFPPTHWDENRCSKSCDVRTLLSLIFFLFRLP